jgi:hypothetical protein
LLRESKREIRQSSLAGSVLSQSVSKKTSALAASVLSSKKAPSSKQLSESGKKTISGSALGSSKKSK